MYMIIDRRRETSHSAQVGSTRRILALSFYEEFLKYEQSIIPDNRQLMITEIKDAFQDIKRIGKLSRDGVFIFNVSENRFHYANNCLIKIIEISKKLLTEDPSLVIQSIPTGDDEYLKIRYHELFQREFVEDVQFRLVQNDVHKLLSCNAYLTPDRSFIMGFVKDISKPKQHEEYLVNFGARKDAILDGVSQHLSTPLNLSKFTADLIEKALKEKKYHKLHAHLEVMREVTAECVEIINNFLIQEHMASPNVHTKDSRFEMMSKIMIVLDKMKELNADKVIKVKTDVKHLFINGDDLKFFQIIHNLLSNAVKFTRPKGQIDVVVKDKKNTVEIAIQDQGIGIPETLQPFIFERNTKAAREGLKGETSTGIGLYITKKLVERMHGKISFESKENKGTKFVLEFPKY